MFGRIRSFFRRPYTQPTTLRPNCWMFLIRPFGDWSLIAVSSGGGPGLVQVKWICLIAGWDLRLSGEATGRPEALSTVQSDGQSVGDTHFGGVVFLAFRNELLKLVSPAQEFFFDIWPLFSDLSGHPSLRCVITIFWGGLSVAVEEANGDLLRCGCLRLLQQRMVLKYNA